MAFTSWMICPKGLPAPLISIHAPRTGSDPTPAMNSWKAAYFNPRSPHGERRTSTERGDAIGRISIYAPRTGSDRCAVRRKTAATYFNPRSPHGERRSEDDVLHPASVFQSTLPARGGTVGSFAGAFGADISIHAPRTGSDAVQRFAQSVADISIHAPRTGSDSQARREEARREISIHAPRTGSDRGGFLRRCLVTISIHAPRTGSDRCNSGGMIFLTEFQSTLPARGATRVRSCAGSPAGYFNPRSPHGERHEQSGVLLSPLPFQSTLPARGATFPAGTYPWGI